MLQLPPGSHSLTAYDGEEVAVAWQSSGPLACHRQSNGEKCFNQVIHLRHYASYSSLLWTIEIAYELKNHCCMFYNQRVHQSWTWWCTPDIPALGRLRQGRSLFKNSLDYIARLSEKEERGKEEGKKGETEKIQLH